MFNYQYVHDCWTTYNSSQISQVISPRETMMNQWYFEVGENAVHVILSALASSQQGNVRAILDIPCGHGRVLRHLVKLFPDAEVTACDLDVDGVEFCASEFGAKPVLSKANLIEVDFPCKFDLIWVGSLFTHVTKAQSMVWLHHLAKYLSDTGVIVATFHGRRAIDVYETTPYISSSSWQHIIKSYRETGYGYADYSQQENHDYIEHSYGVSLSKAATIIDIVETIPEVRVFSYIEAGWADNQDVLVFGRPSL